MLPRTGVKVGDLFRKYGLGVPPYYWTGASVPERLELLGEVFFCLLRDDDDWSAVRALRSIRKSLQADPGFAEWSRLTVPSPPKRRGRPRGRCSVSRDEAFAIVEALKHRVLSKAEILRILGKDPHSASSYRWINRRIALASDSLLPPRRTGLTVNFKKLPNDILRSPANRALRSISTRVLRSLRQRSRKKA